MWWLHAADSVSHIGGPSVLRFVAAVLGVGVGAFFVFGMPGVLQRSGRNKPVVSESQDENIGGS